MSMTEKEFDDYVLDQCKEVRGWADGAAEDYDESEKIEYLEKLGYETHYPDPEAEFGFVSVSKSGSNGIGPNLEMAFKYEKAKELEGEKTKNLLCNKCGGDMNIYWGEGEGEPYGLVNASVAGGYLSDPLKDTTTYKFNICEHCLHELFLEFKNPPDISMYLI